MGFWFNASLTLAALSVNGISVFGSEMVQDLSKSPASFAAVAVEGMNEKNKFWFRKWFRDKK